MTKEKTKIKYKSPSSSWSQTLLLVVIIFTGLSGFLLPIPLQNQLIMIGAMFVATIGAFVYFLLSSSHKNNDLELLFDIVFGAAIFMVIFASGSYGMWYMYALFMLSISDAIIYNYRQLFLILTFFSAGLCLYYFTQYTTLPVGSGWLIIINTIAIWATTHFVWFYAKDANVNLVENQLAASKLKQMEMLERRRTEFLQIATHQLKNPLTIIKFILVNTIESKGLSDKKKQDVKQAVYQSEKAIQFIDDTTKILSIESGQKYIKQEVVEVELLLKEVLTQLADIAKQKKISINKHISGIIPSTLSDVFYLKIAITNIIDNAIKYSKENSTISITVSSENKYISIIVKDNGIGISKADQIRLFEKFFRGSNAEVMQPHGTGLGLYLVKTVVEKLQGKIFCTSTYGRGTTFTIQVPVK